MRSKTSRPSKRRGRNEAAEARLRRGCEEFSVASGREQEASVTRWTHTDWLRWRGKKPQERKFNSAVALTEAAADEDRADARSALRGRRSSRGETKRAGDSAKGTAREDDGGRAERRKVMVDAGNQNPATRGLQTLKDPATLRETRGGASRSWREL